MKGPVHEWPLALCDADSVSPGNDFVANDTVFSADVVRENVMVHFNATHRWHYLSDQMPSELLVFRQVDSELGPGRLQLCILGLLYNQVSEVKARAYKASIDSIINNILIKHYLKKKYIYKMNYK